LGHDDAAIGIVSKKRTSGIRLETEMDYEVKMKKKNGNRGSQT